MQLRITKKELFNIPNILTYIRILCIPAFALVYFLVKTPIGDVGYSLGTLIGFGIFVFASVTDLVDGKIARKYGLTSDLGAILDPFADKLLQGAAVICLCITDNMHWIFPVLFVAKELYMILGAAYLANKNIVGKANVYGKAAAFIMAIAILLAFFVRPENEANGVGRYPIEKIIDMVIMGIGLAISYFAAFSYTKMVVSQLREKGLKKASDVHLDFSTPNSDLGAPDKTEDDTNKTEDDTDKKDN